ncbi:hypothetical protein L345_13984, partial [Ophiophagus hannah]
MPEQPPVVCAVQDHCPPASPTRPGQPQGGCSAAVCVFEGKTYFGGERQSVYLDSEVCILFECKIWVHKLSNFTLELVRGHDFCSEGHKCLENSFCRNVEEKSVCSCRDGFRALRDDSVYCEDIEECAEGRHYCQENTMCINTPGSFMCVCKTGYIRIDDYSCTEQLELIKVIVGKLNAQFFIEEMNYNDKLGLQASFVLVAMLQGCCERLLNYPIIIDCDISNLLSDMCSWLGEDDSNSLIQ